MKTRPTLRRKLVRLATSDEQVRGSAREARKKIMQRRAGARSVTGTGLAQLTRLLNVHEGGIAVEELRELLRKVGVSLSVAEWNWLRGGDPHTTGRFWAEDIVALIELPLDSADRVYHIRDENNDDDDDDDESDGKGAPLGVVQKKRAGGGESMWLEGEIALLENEIDGLLADKKMQRARFVGGRTRRVGRGDDKDVEPGVRGSARRLVRSRSACKR